MVGWQQFVSRDRLWGWHCGCAGLVAGEVLSACCFAGTQREYKGWVPKKVQTKGSAEAGAGEEIARASRSTMTSGLSQTSGWTAAVHRESAPC